MISTTALIALLDVTRLVDGDDPQQFATWLTQSTVPALQPAAYCVYPQFLLQTAAHLQSHGIAARLATVVNFPSGAEPLADVVRQIENALAAGAHEIDAVLPYRALLAGELETVHTFMQAVRLACGGACLKIIIESGELASAEMIAQATEIALLGGADFVKTSTGKVPVGATIEATGVILSQLARSTSPVGFKASGGVRDKAFALELVALFTEQFGREPTADVFRIGASTLYLDLVRDVGGQS